MRWKHPSLCGQPRFRRRLKRNPATESAYFTSRIRSPRFLHGCPRTDDWPCRLTMTPEPGGTLPLYASLPCVWTAASVRVPRAIPEMPDHTKPLLFAKTSVCPHRMPLYFWIGRNLHAIKFALFTYVYSVIYNAVTLYISMHIQCILKVRADKFKTSFEICCYTQNYRLYKMKQIELNLNCLYLRMKESKSR